MYQKITSNLLSAKKRYETLDGEEYIVLPTVMLTEGVHEGTSGPLLYESKELSRSPMSWNHKPVVLYHPTMNGGEGISACSPDVLERQGLGFMFETSWDGRLKTETWLKKNKIQRLDPSTYQRIENNEMIEVSTGLFHELDKKDGTWNSEKYTGIVRDIQPDHLAILPDQKGACSIADGAGLLRNSAGQIVNEGLSLDDIRTQISSLLRDDRKSDKTLCDDFCYVCDVYAKSAIYESKGKSYKIGYKVKNGKVILDGMPEEVRKVTNYVTTNGRAVNSDAFSLPVRKEQLESALKAKFVGGQPTENWSGSVTEVLDSHVIYNKNNQLFRLSYTCDADKINFDGEPQEVEKVSEYREKRSTPVDGSQSPYSNNLQQGSDMATKQQLDTIIRLGELAKTNPQALTLNVIHQGANQLLHEVTHSDAHEGDPSKGDSQVRSTAGGSRKEMVSKMISGGHAKEEDRKFLEELPDDGFEKVSKYVLKGATQPITEYSYEGVGDRSNVHNTGTQTAQQYIQNAPPEVREVLQESMNSFVEKKKQLVQKITSNQSNRFTPEWLMLQPMAMLTGMAALVSSGQQRPTANNGSGYSGQGGVQMFLDAPTITQNAGDTEDDEVLSIPTMNFDKKTA